MGRDSLPSIHSHITRGIQDRKCPQDSMSRATETPPVTHRNQSHRLRRVNLVVKRPRCKQTLCRSSSFFLSFLNRSLLFPGTKCLSVPNCSFCAKLALLSFFF